MSSTNQAAWVNEPKATFQVGSAPMYTPGPDEIVVQIRAVAINPMESMIQKLGLFLKEYPAVLGSDGAGEVYAVGTDVKSFQVGDRVMACFDGIPPFPKADYRRNCFQKFAVARASLAAKLPDSVSFIDASVLPLCITSAADGLFSDHGMQLGMPQLSAQEPKGQTVVVWAASSSMGACAIQLLVAAGYEVVAVAGSHNHELCLSIGAKQAFDHKSASVIEDIVKASRDVDIAGIYTCVMAKDAVEKSTELYIRLGKKGNLGAVFPPGGPLPCEVPDGVEFKRSR